MYLSFSNQRQYSSLDLQPGGWEGIIKSKSEVNFSIPLTVRSLTVASLIPALAREYEEREKVDNGQGWTIPVQDTKQCREIASVNVGLCISHSTTPLVIGHLMFRTHSGNASAIEDRMSPGVLNADKADLTTKTRRTTKCYAVLTSTG